MCVCEGLRCVCDRLSVPASGCLLELDSSNSNTMVRSNPSSDLWGDFSGSARFAGFIRIIILKIWCFPSVIAPFPLVCFQLRPTTIATSGPRTLDPVLSCGMPSFDVLSSLRMRPCLLLPARHTEINPRLTPRISPFFHRLCGTELTCYT